MRRREFIALVGGAAAGLPTAAHAQQPDRMRRIGLLMNLAPNDSEVQRRVTALVEGLKQSGWADGRNVQIDSRMGTGDGEQIRKLAAELVANAPDVIVSNAPPSVLALQQLTRTVPIVFTAVTDPVGMGIVQSLARPGGNVTGFASAEFGLSAKWLELLKQITPAVNRVAVIQDPGNAGGIPQFAAIQGVASSFGVELSTLFIRDAAEIDKAVATFARKPNGGLIVTRTSAAIDHRNLLVQLAARHRLPTVYPLRFFATGGGLISYGPDIVHQYRLAASYVDRILKGEKPADLPVQAPTKYELVLNLKAAKALGIDVPSSVLARADEVIE